MKTKSLLVFAVLLLVVVLAFPQTVLAHQNIQIGDYAVEYGWVNEPAVANQPNAVVINITGANGDTNIDITNLQIQAVLGGEKKMLTLQPLGESTPGQFIAPMTPTRAGTYTFHLSGTVGPTAFNNDVTPEEVHTADLVQFPLAATAAQTASGLGLEGWLGLAGIILGALGIFLAVLALSKKPAQ
jgi:hypothetical protein